jgi:hypothetical protein
MKIVPTSPGCCARMVELKGRAPAFPPCNERNAAMPIILWLLGVPLVVVILLMLVGFV